MKKTDGNIKKIKFFFKKIKYFFKHKLFKRRTSRIEFVNRVFVCMTDGTLKNISEKEWLALDKKLVLHFIYMKYVK